jgi:hypothetical protein
MCLGRFIANGRERERWRIVLQITATGGRASS